ncbi:FMN-binding negative transcriptional regulator [Prosthecomicrobium sp. N25]|uniref:FMN-binding negative transcriptional regulator n=1 Tax=Prosthecomicrobium sp. N25 TaxID=3129254 RepID=UPI003076A7E3
MYRPPHFAVDDLPLQHELIRAHPLGLLVVHGSAGLTADPVPFVLDADRGPFGTLRCHVARANPVWREADGAREALVVFSAVDHYVTPSWYATKRETGKVVPTWNYATVHAHGPMRAIEDPAWLAAQIAALTDIHEGRRAAPWSVDDAPAPFIAAQMRGIVGLEIPIARIEGKWKVSQNRPETDRRGVDEGLRAEGDEEAAAMAALVRQHGGIEG